jgi:hypothetical protein
MLSDVFKDVDMDEMYITIECEGVCVVVQETDGTSWRCRLQKRGVNGIYILYTGCCSPRRSNRSLS